MSTFDPSASLDSTFAKPGRLTLSSGTPGIQLTVLDSELRPVGTDTNWFQQQVPAGVYLVEGRVGAVASRRLTTVAPGSDVREVVDVQFATAAPTAGAWTTNETHADLAELLSAQLATSDGPSAGLIIVLRNLRKSDDPPRRDVDVGTFRSEPEPLHIGELQVLDDRYQRVRELPPTWLTDQDGGAAGVAARLEPGGYLLRSTRRSPDGRILERVIQTVWLAPGWQTLVFVPNTPLGPDTRGMSVQMAGLHSTWNFYEREGRAAEAALVGLRDGITPVEEQAMEALLYGKFENPMLGIIGLHALLLRRHVSEHVLRQVVENLRYLVGDHPDVVALATATFGELADESVASPPMLERSYRNFLLPADQRRQGTLVEGSLATTVAPLIRMPGPWLRWSDTSNPDHPSQPVPEGLDRDVWHAATGAAQFVVDEAPGTHDLRLALSSTYRAALGVVGEAVVEIAKFNGMAGRDVVATIGPSELARRTGLTESLVRHCLELLNLSTIAPDE